MRPLTPRASARSQRGAAALIVTLLLFLAMALGALALQRSLGVEQRHAANQARAIQAFEAAEAGLAWAQAQLNSARPIDASCQPGSGSAALSFRERALRIDGLSGAIGVVATLQPACVRGASGWSCRCGAGTSALADPGGEAVAPAFSLSMAPGDQPGLVRIAAHGCTRLAGDCVPGSATATDATATTSVTLALFPGLRTPPAVALTVRETTRQTDEQFFAGFFGLDQATWRHQPTVARVVCNGDCGGLITEAIVAGQALIAVDGDLALSGPLTLGTIAHPVVVVASGTLRLDGPVSIVGALYAASVVIGTPGAAVRGAVMTESGYAGPSSPGFRFDADVLATLRHQTGSFVRVGGSWRDF